MKIKYEKIFQEQLDLAKRIIKAALVPLSNLSEGQIRDLIGAYRVAIEPNFIPWMQRAYKTARSEVARKVILENIQDEVSQDHRDILHSPKGLGVLNN